MPLNDEPDHAEAPLGTAATLDGEDQVEEGGESDADRPRKRKKPTFQLQGSMMLRLFGMMHVTSCTPRSSLLAAAGGLHF